MKQLPVPKSSVLLLVFAWLVVILPLSWGLYQSVMKSKPLFIDGNRPLTSPAAAKTIGAR
jgi:hypothetical protein